MRIIKSALKTILFLIIGVVLFLGIQRLLCPRWNYPNATENIYTQITAFENLDPKTEQVIFLGTSHMARGISPMDIYSDNKIVSYNLGTSMQTLESSYYLVKEAFRTQEPKVIVLDASSLFLDDIVGRDSSYEISMRYIIDSLPLNKTKYEMAVAYSQMSELGKDNGIILRSENKDERFMSCFFPILQYHSRWNELGESDFRDFFKYKDHYAAGYHLGSVLIPGSSTLKTVDAIANKMMEINNEQVSFTYQGGLEYTSQNPKDIYSVEITKDNIEYFQRIKDLCDQHNAILLLTKVPCIVSPASYVSSWTQFRYNAVKDLAGESGVEFIDLQYDVDLGMDISKDFYDGGRHLNANGVQKVSRFLGNYLKEHYDLESKTCPAYEAYIPYYEEMLNLANLHLTTDPIEYLDYLSKNSNRYILIMACKNDMKKGLNLREIEALSNLGLQVDWDNELKEWNSYLAVIDEGHIEYEAASSRLLSYTYKMSNESEVEMTSAGYFAGSSAMIIVDGENLSKNGNGLNIIVYDKELDAFIDSVSINFDDKDNKVDSKTKHTVSHSIALVNSSLRETEFAKVLKKEK